MPTGRPVRLGRRRTRAALQRRARPLMRPQQSRRADEFRAMRESEIAAVEGAWTGRGQEEKVTVPKTDAARPPGHRPPGRVAPAPGRDRAAIDEDTAAPGANAVAARRRD